MKARLKLCSIHRSCASLTIVFMFYAIKILRLFHLFRLAVAMITALLYCLLLCRFELLRLLLKAFQKISLENLSKCLKKKEFQSSARPRFVVASVFISGLYLLEWSWGLDLFRKGPAILLCMTSQRRWGVNSYPLWSLQTVSLFAFALCSFKLFHAGCSDAQSRIDKYSPDSYISFLQLQYIAK